MINTKILQQSQYPNGLFSASPNKKTGYHRVWIRDNVYIAIGLESTKPEIAKKIFHSLLDIIKKHESKIDAMIANPSKDKMQHIHARYDPVILEEIKEEWGNKQSDAIGVLLLKISKHLRDENDKSIIQKLVNYLAAIEYWHNPDNGMWEETEELHASSIGACVAGLKAVKNIVKVPEELIKKGEIALNLILPKESETKDVDLSLLSLIYPHNIVTEQQKNTILKNVEEKLARNKGVIRFINDKYYEKDGKEAEWPLGFIWLAIIHKKNPEKHKLYLEKAKATLDNEAFPELYYGNTNQHNENIPLNWAQSLWLQV